MSVLISGHGTDRDAMDAARRITSYRTLVLLTPSPGAEELAAILENESLAGASVELVGVDAADLHACLREARAAITRHARTDVRVHVAGGPNLLTSALLLAAFHEGREAFYCHPHGVSRLPVALDVKLEDRLTPAEQKVLLALEATPTRLDTLSADISAAALKGTLLRLRRARLVDATHEIARLTPAGAYYRDHLRTRPPP